MVPVHGRLIPVALIAIALFATTAIGAVRSDVASPAQAADLTGERLRDRARPGLEVGGVLHGYDPEWSFDPTRTVIEDEMSAVTATAYVPWGGWPNRRQGPDTSGFTAVVDWATERGLAVHGHTLVYPRANAASPWFSSLKRGHKAVLRRWVKELAGARSGDVWVWDVVNEVLADPGDPAVDGWGLKTDWIEYQRIGPDYVDRAFRWAKAADPDALLILNDYGAEEINEKSDRLLAYVIELRDRGVPIDGVGFQMHLWSDGSQPDWASIRANFQRFADAGFDLFITELDVPIVRTSNPSDQPSAAQRAIQRSVFEEAARIANEQPAVQSLLLWDLADDRSWLHPTRTDLGPDTPMGTFTFPAPFSGGRIGVPPQPKAAWWGLHEGLLGGASVPADGGHLLTSVHRPRASLLTRQGVSDDGASWTTTASIERNRSTKRTRAWTSTTWQFVQQTDGTVVITNRWEPETGVLTRVGNAVELRPADGSVSQRWRLESADRSWRIVSMDRPETGVLTSGSRAVGVRLDVDRGAVAANPGAASVSRQRWIVARSG